MLLNIKQNKNKIKRKRKTIKEILKIKDKS